LFCTLEVVTSEMAPAAAVARNAAIADSASLVSVMSRKSASPSREIKVYKFAAGSLNQLPHNRFSVLRRRNQSLGMVPGEPPTRNQSDHECLPLRFVIIATEIIIQTEPPIERLPQV
jgi:hypothetical protein